MIHCYQAALPRTSPLEFCMYFNNFVIFLDPKIGNILASFACAEAPTPGWTLFHQLLLTRKLYFIFLSHSMGYDRGDSFPFDFLNQMEFYLVQNRKENCLHDHIPLHLKGNGNIVFPVIAECLDGSFVVGGIMIENELSIYITDIWRTSGCDFRFGIIFKKKIGPS